MEESTYKCYYDFCHRVYKTKFNLRRHINSSHLKIKCFLCSDCKKQFVSKQNLKEHMLIHTGEKPFICEELGCGKKFRQASQLLVHRRIHDRQRVAMKCHMEIQPLLLTDIEIPKDFYFQAEPKKKKEEKIELPIISSDKIVKNSKLPVLPILLNHI
ncbi:unnamed protein product [Blepharisma stoltei]|uniref:C2H2-type domain-containing protein n=1 Tax=Blepharisma stoltei TaxID=1481888 RepID=A0AAU9I9V1_9CILI|nr:unnamed protein product [Blepharisma stoltei]